MGLSIHPLEHHELDEFLRVHWAAFEPIEVNMIYPMIYPLGFRDDLLARMRSRVLRQTGGDLAAHCFCAKDHSGTIIAISWWTVVDDPPKTDEEIDRRFRKAYAARNLGDGVEGFQSDLDYAFFKAAFYSEAKVVQGKPYMGLRMLATDPQHNRRGAGSLLLKHGLRKADQLQLPVYLDSGIAGRDLYARHGFEITCDFPLNCLEYGGRSDGRHWCMLRPAAEENVEDAVPPQ
jgi:GNAT superfamily N-acetyltransferase